jgi:NADH:ubiquinone oxidoreductase subunit 6 (subunit J)
MALFLDIPFPDLARGLWPIALPVLLGLAAVCLLLPRPRGYPGLTGAVLAGAALLAAGWFLIRGGAADPPTVLFYAFAGIAVTAGGLMVTQRNPARAALSFALVVLATCGLFLLQAAPFLMAATVIVYAGAIVVTFLFVLMLAQQAGKSDADHRSREPVLATTAGFVLLGAVLYVLNLTYESSHEFHDMLAQVYSAKQATSIAEIESTLRPPEKEEFFARLLFVAGEGRGVPVPAKLVEKIRWLGSEWPKLRAGGDLDSMKAALDDLDRSSRPSLPAANVGYLGRLLFTEYLVAVELGGTLLLVATIGAIAITSRRTEETS